MGAFVGFITLVVLALTWLERKFLARLQQRLGPTRTGPFGLLQPVADAIKLLTKEDLLPARADKISFWFAPVVVFVPAFLVWVTVPFTQDIVIRNLEWGVLYVIAVSSLSTAGLLMAGWGSFNKYAMLGAVRGAAQLMSYELPLIVAVLGVVMIVGSLDLTVIVDEQTTVWFIVLQPAAFLIFLLAGLAEVSRAPFDIPLAESELAGGPFIEYSGIHWSMFSMAEYAATFAIAVLTTLIFLGGWRGPAPASGWGEEVAQATWLLGKTMAVMFVIFWIRASVPRLRIDQLMSFAWKVLLPMAFANMVLTAIYLFYGWPDWSIVLMSLALIGAVTGAYYQRRRARLDRISPMTLRVEKGRLVG